MTAFGYLHFVTCGPFSYFLKLLLKEDKSILPNSGTSDHLLACEQQFLFAFGAGERFIIFTRGTGSQ